VRVLHIGWGFYPWRAGGLIEYTESLMKKQVQQGYKVAYFCSGRIYPFIKKTSIKKWKKNNYEIFEIINPTIYHGGDEGTLFDIESETIEKLFQKVLFQFKPNVIHIQELAGLPSSLIDIIYNNNIPCVMTLHDYFLLCPTLKLLDYNYQNCLEYHIENKCPNCIKSTPNNNKKLLMIKTLHHDFKPLINILPNSIKNFFREIFLTLRKNFLYKNQNTPKKTVIENNENYFQKRREINIERLKKIDLLIAQSKRLEEIYKHFVPNLSIKTVNSPAEHIEKIKPKHINCKIPVKFGTLNGMASIQKGAYLLLDTINILQKLQDKFELHIFGAILPTAYEKIKNYKNIFYHGKYKIEELNNILENINVGIIPSIWEEAYGYVGLEFLSKGIPIISNNKGGITEYTIENLTGWVNKSSSAQELAQIMENIINNPEIVNELNQKIIKNRDKIIKTMDQHLQEIHQVYTELINNKK